MGQVSNEVRLVSRTKVTSEETVKKFTTTRSPNETGAEKNNTHKRVSIEYRRWDH